MFTPEMNYLVALEQHKDHIRNAERRHLLTTAMADRPNWYRQRCYQLGRLLKTWGTRLEQIGEPASPNTQSVQV